MEDSIFFDELSGNVVALPRTDNPALTQRWVIGKQLSEDDERVPEADVARGRWPLYAAGKFEYHCEDDGKRGFMRIYLQAPHLKTEF